MTVPTLKTPCFDHISLGVADLDRSTKFWDAALGALGWERLWKQSNAAGYGPEGFAGEAPLAIIQQASAAPPGPGFHMAFIAADRDAVRDFYAAAIDNGGSDDGPPGVRDHYDPGYFAAFVIDPDGHRIEVVVHEVVPGASDRDVDEEVLARVSAARNAPGNVALQLEAAYACDEAGHEFLAVEFYDAAQKLGVPDESRRVFQVCYGSTLRNVGRTREAAGLFDRHLEEHPGDLEARSFRALNRLTGGSPDTAVAELLDIIIELQGESAESGFWPALASYRDELATSE